MSINESQKEVLNVLSNVWEQIFKKGFVVPSYFSHRRIGYIHLCGDFLEFKNFIRDLNERWNYNYNNYYCEHCKARVSDEKITYVIEEIVRYLSLLSYREPFEEIKKAWRMSNSHHERRHFIAYKDYKAEIEVLNHFLTGPYVPMGSGNECAELRKNYAYP